MTAEGSLVVPVPSMQHPELPRRVATLFVYLTDAALRAEVPMFSMHWAVKWGGPLLGTVVC